MKITRIRYYILVCCCILSCTEYTKPIARPTGVPDVASVNEDTTFVQTNDTVSTQGPHSITRSILRDKNGKLWFASWQGALSYDGHQFTNITLMEGINHFHIFSLLEDRGRNLWLGSIKGGAFRYDPIRHTVTQFTVAEGLAGHSVLCMQQDKQGKIWLGTTTGLSHHDPLSRGASVFTNYTTLEGLNNNTVNALLEDTSGKLWIGTNGGLCYYDPAPPVWAAGKSFTQVMNKAGQPFNNVRALTQDKNGIIWIACQDGLWRYDSNTGAQSMIRVHSYFTGCVFEDKAGMLWISQWEPNGSLMTLSRYDGKTFKRYAESGQIFGIAEDKHGTIWFGTERGARHLDPLDQNR
jgi:ligand-binding sensor domain-containing protein